MTAMIQPVDLLLGQHVSVKFTGPAARIYLLDEANLFLYRTRQQFNYVSGGFYNGHPGGRSVDLLAPHPGRWNVVIDHGGIPGFLSASYGVVPPST